MILLMFSLGIEFSLQKLLRVGPTAGFVAVVQCSLMIWLGYLAGQAFGWSRLASFYAGAVISISSTTIIVKAFEEQRIKADFTQIVFGVLIVEDLIAILLITVLTALSAGEEVTPLELGVTAGRLGAISWSLLVGGPADRAAGDAGRRATRSRRNHGRGQRRAGLRLRAAGGRVRVLRRAWVHFSPAAWWPNRAWRKTVEHLVQPVRDIFAAIFFVSVGMLIDPARSPPTGRSCWCFSWWSSSARLVRHRRRVSHRAERANLGQVGHEPGADRRVLVHHRRRRHGDAARPTSCCIRLPSPYRASPRCSRPG